jgi:FkbM family methyltransferase
MEVLNDLPARLPGRRFATILDVGAHVGQTTLELKVAFPDATVLAFEPIEDSFAELTSATADLEGVSTYQVALGGSPGTAWMKNNGTSTANAVIAPGRESPGDVQVEVVTGDAFCAEAGIEHVDFLKVDAVGQDLEVLRGFHGLLGDGEIDVVQVEASMYSGAQRQIPLERFRGYLEPLGYHVFGIYSPRYGHRGLPVLARADVVFLSPATLEAHTVSA